MKFYELLYIARSDLTAAQLDDLNNNITNIIKGILPGSTVTNNENKSTSENKIDKVESWGVKTLAYKSKNLKRNKGNYCIITFYLDNPEILKELNNRLKLNESILRFIIKKTNINTSSLKPSIAKKNNVATVS